MNEITRFPHIPNVSPRTAQLVKLLSTTDAERISDDELATCATGVSCKPKGLGYSNLQTAIKRVERDKQIVWRRQRGGDCIVRLGAEGVVQNVRDRGKHIGRTARRSGIMLVAVDPEELPVPKRGEHYAQVAICGAIAKLADTRTRKRLETTAKGKPLQLEEVIHSYLKTKQADTT